MTSAIFRSKSRYYRQAPPPSDRPPNAGTLATEILDMIISYLDPPILAHVTSLVCRNWFASSRPRVHFGVHWICRERQKPSYNQGILLAPLTSLYCFFGGGFSKSSKDVIDEALFSLVERHSRTPTPPDTFRVPNRFSQGTVRGTLQRLTLRGGLSMELLKGIFSRLRLDVITTFHIIKLDCPLYNWHVLLDVLPNLKDLSLEYQVDHYLSSFLDLDLLEQFKSKTSIFPMVAVASAPSGFAYRRPLVSLVLMNVTCYPIELKNVLRNCPNLQKLHVDFQSMLWTYDRRFYKDFLLFCPLLNDFRIPGFSLTSAGVESLLDLLSGDLTGLSLPVSSLPRDIYTIVARQCPRLEELEISSTSMHSSSGGETLKIFQAYLTSPDAQGLKSVRVFGESFFADNFDINQLHNVKAPAVWKPNPATFYSLEIESHMIEDPNSEWCRAGNPPRKMPAVQIREVWTCRFLETLHLTIAERTIERGAHTDIERSRILFGFISKVLPLLRDLSIEQAGMRYSIEGGACLLTRLHFLEKLVLKPTYERSIYSYDKRRSDKKVLSWIQKFPSQAQRLAWVLKARHLKMKDVGFRKNASVTKDPVPAVTTTGSIKTTKGKEVKGDIRAYWEHSRTASSAFEVTKEDLINCGYMDDVIELLEETKPSRV